jgi:hypothetical protein
MTDESAPPPDSKPDAEPAGDIRTHLEATLRDLKALGTEIGRQVGASAKGATREVSEDAKAAWAKLEPQLHAAEKELRGATDAAVGQLKGLFADLRASLRSLRERVGGPDDSSESTKP